MAALLYTPQAKRDLIDIGCYIAQRNPHAANQLTAEIYDACDRLRDFPLSGQIMPEIRSDVRHLVVGNYQVIYWVHKENVEILRVLHGARYLPGLL